MTVNTLNAMKLAALVLISSVFVMLGTQCTSSDGPKVDEKVAQAQSSDFAIMRVGEEKVMVSDILARNEIYRMLNDTVLNELIIKQEAKKRGIVVEMTVVEDEFSKVIEQFGSIDALKQQQFPPYMPNEVIVAQIKDYFYMNRLQRALFSDEYYKTHQKMTDEEVQNYVEQNQYIKQQVAQDKKIPEEGIPLDLLREKVEEIKVQEWMGQPEAQEFMKNIRDNADYEIYLDQINGFSSAESVEVPKMPEQEPEAEEEMPLEDVNEGEGTGESTEAGAGH